MLRLICILLLIGSTAFAQPARPKAPSHYSQEATVIRWRTTKEPDVAKFIADRVSTGASEDETLNELAKKALFYYLTKDPYLYSNPPKLNTPKKYIPDSLFFDLRVLKSYRTSNKEYHSLSNDETGQFYKISTTNIDYTGYYVEKYGSVWIDKYNPEEGAYDGYILIICDLWYDDGKKPWTQNADLY